MDNSLRSIFFYLNSYSTTFTKQKLQIIGLTSLIDQLSRNAVRLNINLLKMIIWVW